MRAYLIMSTLRCVLLITIVAQADAMATVLVRNLPPGDASTLAHELQSLYNAQSASVLSYRQRRAVSPFGRLVFPSADEASGALHNVLTLRGCELRAEFWELLDVPPPPAPQSPARTPIVPMAALPVALAKVATQPLIAGGPQAGLLVHLRAALDAGRASRPATAA